MKILILKYDEMLIMSNFLEENIYETGESFCDVTIKLADNVRTEKREYTKLVTILGDVGGLMEVVLGLFKIMCSFSVDILYDISLVNTLNLVVRVPLLKYSKSNTFFSKI
jgi:hypothetical protein